MIPEMRNMGSREKCSNLAPLSNTDVQMEGARLKAKEPKLMIKSALIIYAIGSAGGRRGSGMRQPKPENAIPERPSVSQGGRGKPSKHMRRVDEV